MHLASFECMVWGNDGMCVHLPSSDISEVRDLNEKENSNPVQNLKQTCYV